MVDTLSIIALLALVIQAVIGLAFLVSSIWEKEPRATIFGVLQFLGMLLPIPVFIYLWRNGFFNTTFNAGQYNPAG